mgnify:FL=1
MSEKRRTFNKEFRLARKTFEDDPTAKNFIFTSKVDGGKKTVLKKGETKQGLMKKFKSESNAEPTNSQPGYIRRKKAGTRIVKDTKLADITEKELGDWKTKNKGKYKGKALTAYLNNKGRNISGSDAAQNNQKELPSERKVISTKKVIVANAKVRKLMRQNHPKRLSNIEIGDTVFFRTNSAGDLVVASIVKKEDKR